VKNKAILWISPFLNTTRSGKNAKENAPCYPDDLSFASTKAGATDDYVAEIEWLLFRIPLLCSFPPSHWKKCIDVMILKKLGVMHLSGL
jgi:hypothetical protein